MLKRNILDLAACAMFFFFISLCFIYFADLESKKLWLPCREEATYVSNYVKDNTEASRPDGLFWFVR